MDPLDQLGSRFTGLRLREETPSGRVYAASDGTGREVTVAVLAGPAATDPAVRSAFADAVWRHSIDGPAGRATVSAADLHAVFPWAALRTPPGQPGAEQLLTGPGAAPEPPPPDAPSRPNRLSRLNRAGSPWPWLLGAAGGVLLVLLAATGIAGVQAVVATDPGPAPTGPTADPDQPGEPGEPGEPVQSDPDLPGLRQVPPVSLLGPTFDAAEPALTMAFVGWPFAFRTPPGWHCFEERLDRVPTGDYYQCQPERDDPDQLVAVLLWPCPTSCPEGEQQEMLATWLDEPEAATRSAATPTAYVETGRNRDGYYTVDLGHFAAAEPDGPLRWMVGVYVEAPVPRRADVQKVLNDIVSQSTR